MRLACVGYTDIGKALRSRGLPTLAVDDMAVNATVVGPRQGRFESVSLSDLYFITFQKIVPLRRGLRSLNWSAHLSGEQLALCATCAFCALLLAPVYSF